MTKSFSLLALLMWLASPAHAGPGYDRLQQFFLNVKSATASFQQTVTDASLAVVQESAGTMQLQRPNKFRWDYLKPYKQLIISNGSKVSLYDVDLAQVTVRGIDQTLGNTPATLLSGTEPLDKNFRITELGAREGLEWVELVPKSKEATYERMLLAFSAEGLKQMELVDALSQVTRLIFSEVRTNVTLSPETFEFTPPKGVDVIDDSVKVSPLQ